MDYRHEILLNMYYRNPDNAPSLIPDWFCSLSIDLTQLLLMTEEVFNDCQYRFLESGMHVKIAPLECHRQACMELVDRADEHLEEAGVIPFFSGQTDVDFFKSQLWNDHMEPEMCSLGYRSTILINNINGTHWVSERDSIAEYCLFSERGEFFLNYLFYMLKEIIINGFLSAKKTMDQMMGFINHGYDLINTVFKKRTTILNELEVREYNSKIYYCLNNESIAFSYWIKDMKQLNRASLFDFIFFNAIEPKRVAVMLIQQMIDILNIISDGQGTSVKWGKELTPQNIKRNLAGWKELNNEVNNLRSGYSNRGFNKQEWAKRYLENLWRMERSRKDS